MTTPVDADAQLAATFGPRPGASGLPVGDLLDTTTVTVDLPVPESVLAIGAHPDDIEFGCGATLAKWAAAGCRVHHLVLTDGAKGSWDAGADLARLAADRASECRTAAAIIDGTTGDDPESEDRVLFLGRIDGELVDGATEQRDLCRIIRTLRPDVVAGHDPWRRYRLHPDHRAAGFLTLGAVVAARDPHFFPDVGPTPHRPRALLLWEPDLPNHVEDVSGFEAVKVEALLAHQSQQVSTMGIADGGPRVPSPAGIDAFGVRVRRQLAAHGAVGRLEAGEAFHLITDV